MEQNKEHKERNKGGRPKKEATEKLKYRVTVKMAAAIFLFIYRQKNGLLNELLGGAEIGWIRRCPTRCGRTYQWNEESALLYL